jgi:hypothetical protein
MATNLGSLDRIARLVIGTAIVVYALPLGIESVIWHWIGIGGTFVVVTAVYALCPVYRGLGISTRIARTHAQRRPA